MDTQTIIDHIEQAINQTEKICNQFQSTEKATECKYWEIEVKSKTEALESRVRGLKTFLQTNRPKRALINAVGKVSKYLFGTMDEDDAEEIRTQIQALDANNKKTLHLMEKQISITSSNFKTMQAKMGNLTAMQTEFEKRLQTLEQQSQHFHDLVGDMLLNRLMLQITARIDKLQQHLNEQYEILTALKLHILHPLLLSTTDLQEIYLEINNYEKEHHIAKDDQITSQLITVSTKVIENEIWVEIQVPLIETHVYTMYHAYEIPTHDEKGISYILDFESPYLLNNTEIQNYIELSQDSIKNQCQACETKSGLAVLACRIPQARIISSEKSNCLINLFGQKEKGEKMCNHKVITHTNEMLVKLHQENAWLYFFSNTQNVLAQCKDGLRQFAIQGSGVMTLTKGCRFSINNYELPYVLNRNSTPEIHQVKAQDLPILTSKAETWTDKVKTINSGQIKITQHTEFHQTMQKGLKDLDELEKEITVAESVPLPTKIQYHTNSAFIALILLILAAVAVHKRKNQSNKDHQTQEQQHPEVVVLQHMSQIVPATQIQQDTSLDGAFNETPKLTAAPEKRVLKF